MQRYLLICLFFSIAQAQEVQYDYKVKIYPAKLDKNTQCTSYVQKITSENINLSQNLKEEEIKALIYKILREIEINRKLIKSINNTCDEEKIIEKLEKIIQDKLYLSRKYTYSYIKKILEEYKNEIISILEESQNNLKKDLEDKIVKAKNDLSSLITQSSIEIKDNLNTIENNVQQIATRVDEIAQSQEKLKESILSSFSFIKYLLLITSIIIIVGFIYLAIRINKVTHKEDYEEEQ